MERRALSRDLEARIEAGLDSLESRMVKLLNSIDAAIERRRRQGRSVRIVRLILGSSGCAGLILSIFFGSVVLTLVGAGCYLALWCIPEPSMSVIGRLLHLSHTVQGPGLLEIKILQNAEAAPAVLDQLQRLGDQVDMWEHAPELRSGKRRLRPTHDNVL